MLIIDLRKTNQLLICTVSEKWEGVGNAYRLEIYSSFNRQTYSYVIPLANNISDKRDRYDALQITNSAFSNLFGLYTYKIYEHRLADDLNEPMDFGLLESGQLKVIADTTVQYQYSQPNKSADDFQVYPG